MAGFIPVEFFRKKSNTFRGITFFSLFPEFPEISVPFVHNTSARLLTAIFPRRQNSRWRVRLEVMNLWWKPFRFMPVKAVSSLLLFLRTSCSTTAVLQVRKIYVLVVGCRRYSPCLLLPRPRPSGSPKLRIKWYGSIRAVFSVRKSAVPFVQKCDDRFFR